MIIKINSGSTKAEIEKALVKIRKKKKGFDASKHFGKVKWDVDGLEYQKKVRNEWK